MTSYSQCGEDVHLFQKYFKGKENRYCIELGALDGETFSNTKLFEKTLNWKCILIEANPMFWGFMIRNRPKAHCYKAFVGKSGKIVDYQCYFNGYRAAMNGVAEWQDPYIFDNYFNDEMKRKEVGYATFPFDPIPLTYFVNESHRIWNIPRFDLLSLDVEGSELEVLQSYDFKIPIDYILIEKNKRMTECDVYLQSLGYSKIENIANNALYKLREIVPPTLQLAEGDSA